MNTRDLPAKRNSKVEKAAQVVMGVVGSGSIMLYQKPSESCAALDSCAKWLSDASNPSVASWSLFFSGGLDFAAVNVFFAVDSIPRFVDYMQKQPRTLEKIKKSSVIALFSGIQILQPLSASLGTGAAPWQTLVTVLGFTPGIVFTSVNLADTHGPQLIAGAGRLLCASQDLRIQHFQQQQTAFLQQANANWRQILSHARDLEIAAQPDMLSFLFEKQEPVQANSWGENPCVHCLLWVV